MNYDLKHYLEQDKLKKHRRRKYYVEHIKKTTDDKIRTNNILTSDIYDKIIFMSHELKTNKEIANELNINYQTLLKWKHKIRSHGHELPVVKSSGRPKIPKNYCPSCGQAIKQPNLSK